MPKIVAAALLAGVVIVLLVVVLRSSRPTDTLPSAFGRLSELAGFVARLREARNPQAFLIVELAGTEDFLQMKHYDDTFELDFPVLTERQRSLAAEVQRVYRSLGHTVVEDKSRPLGDVFLDVYLKTDADLVEAVNKVFEQAFGAEPRQGVIFEWSDLSIGPD